MSELVSKCDVCDGFVDEEDLFCANCGTEARHDRPDQAAAAARNATHNFQCGGCGASMSYDASAGSLRCPFCGSEQLERQRDAKVLAPRRVVPFQVDHDSGIRRMRQWLGRGFWRPGDLSKMAVIAKMAAVYVPFWVFRGQTNTYWTADSSRAPPGARGDWYPLFGENQGDYSSLLVGASGALTASETDALCPYDLNQSVDPDQVDLDDVTVEQFSVQRKYARPLARRGLESLEASACRQYVPGKCRNMKVNVRLEGLSSEPMLLPVWIMAYRYKDSVYRMLINGQSGQVIGQAPFSWRKLVLLIVVIMMMLFGALVMSSFF